MPGRGARSVVRRLGAIGIAGSGRLAQALGRALLQCGEPVVCVAGRDPLRTRLAADFMGPAVEPVEFGELPARASRLLIAVSDFAILPVASALAASAGGDEIALHTCGAKGLEDLQPLRLLGVACGTLHPLQTICSAEQGAAAVRGAAFGIAGDEAALVWAQQIVERLEGHALTIGLAERPLYHAAAVMASNYLAVLIDAAESMLSAATGSSADAARHALAPLIREAVDNVLERGPAAALTGPIERGDIETLRLHLAAFSSVAPSIQSLYRSAGLHTVELAQRKGLAESAAEEMKAILR